MHADQVRIDKLRDELDIEISGSGGVGNGNGSIYLSHRHLPAEQREDGYAIDENGHATNDAYNGKGKCKANYNPKYEVLPFRNHHQPNQEDEYEDEE